MRILPFCLVVCFGLGAPGCRAPEPSPPPQAAIVAPKPPLGASKAVIVPVAAVLIIPAPVKKPVAPPDPHAWLRPIYNTLWAVEADQSLTPKDGDRGRAIGPYQIWEDYWYDATHNTAGAKIHPGRYQDCRTKAYAERVILWYWERHCPKALAAHDIDTLAATFHCLHKQDAHYMRRFHVAWRKYAHDHRLRGGK